MVGHNQYLVLTNHNPHLCDRYYILMPYLEYLICSQTTRLTLSLGIMLATMCQDLVFQPHVLPCKLRTEGEGIEQFRPTVNQWSVT